MLRKILVAASVAVALTITSIGFAPEPVAAGMYKGWFTFGGSTSSTRSFSDGSPARTSVVLFLQKKAGPNPCRATVTVRSGGYVMRYRPVYKYTRNRGRAFGGVVYWPNRATRTTISVQTNGRCVFAVYAK